MPSRLPVAHVRPAWLRWGAVVPLVAAATGLTWALRPAAEHTPFMFFYAVAAAAAVLGGTGPALLAVVISAAIVHFSAPVEALNLVNQVGFLAVCAVIVVLATRAVDSSRRERAQREWSEVSLRSVGDAVIVTDVQGRVLTMNGLAEQLTGWSETEADQQPLGKIFEIVNEYTRTPVENPIDRVCREGRVVGLANHTVLLARDGRETPIDDSGAPIWSEDGRVAGAVLVFRDVSARREVERQRAALLESERAARAEAEAANRSKDEFLAVLSHELRTPLTAVLGWSQVLLRSPGLPPEALRAIDAIERNARRQARLIDDVLDVSRIVSGKLSLELEPVDVGQLVEGAIDTVRPLIDAKRLELRVVENCGGTVLGDSHRLQQAVWNLLSNAVKFTPPGGRVEILAERDDGFCAVTVRDTGVGITPDFLPRVFDRFRQEDSGSTRRFSGLGLGLTIVRHIVEMHGGTVSARSDGHGRGAAFTVRLPLAAAQVAPDLTAERAAVHHEVARLDQLRVLAVDDEPDARGFVSEALRRAGADVRIAGSVAEALEILSEFQADVLIADVEMPGEDGLALLRRVREAGHKMPAIAVTAHSSVEDRLRVLAAGFRQHVPKPVEVRELQLVVASVAPRVPESRSS
jgi:PAS domain S-box-containing protein